MAMRIRITSTQGVSIRIDAVARVYIKSASSSMRLLSDDADDPLSVYTRAPRSRSRQGQDAPPADEGTVTPAMEAAAINEFLAGADRVRLGRSLADVYRAMEAVRRRQDALDDD